MIKYNYLFKAAVVIDSCLNFLFVNLTLERDRSGASQGYMVHIFGKERPVRGINSIVANQVHVIAAIEAVGE